MTGATAVRLARPASSADRGRFALLAVATAVAGALLLAAAHLARLPIGGDDMASYVTESGMRPGTIIATILLIVPALALALQALRVGSVARDRRLAALRLAGATPGEVRRIAAVESAAATFAGGLLAAPAFLLLWIAVGVLPPEAARLLATPGAADALAWLALAPLAALAGAFAGAAVHRHVVAEPLGVRRRVKRSRPSRARGIVALLGCALAVGCLALIPLAVRHTAAETGLFVGMIAGLLGTAFAGGPWLVLATARRLARGDATALLAARRLQADPRSHGRVAAVLLVCGFALGIEALLFTTQVADGSLADNTAFHVTGYALAGLAALAAAGIAVATLVVGAADGLLAARRPLATLATLGVDERTHVRALARQLTATAVPAIMAGALAGGPLFALLATTVNADGQFELVARAMLPGVATALVAGLLVAAVAHLAARLLRPLVRAAIDPENLRAA